MAHILYIALGTVLPLTLFMLGFKASGMLDEYIEYLREEWTKPRPASIDDWWPGCEDKLP